jgi:hypothetical protein
LFMDPRRDTYLGSWPSPTEEMLSLAGSGTGFSEFTTDGIEPLAARIIGVFFNWTAVQ